MPWALLLCSHSSDGADWCCRPELLSPSSGCPTLWTFVPFPYPHSSVEILSLELMGIRRWGLLGGVKVVRGESSWVSSMEIPCLSPGVVFLNSLFPFGLSRTPWAGYELERNWKVAELTRSLLTHNQIHNFKYSWSPKVSTRAWYRICSFKRICAELPFYLRNIAQHGLEIINFTGEPQGLICPRKPALSKFCCVLLESHWVGTCSSRYNLSLNNHPTMCGYRWLTGCNENICLLNHWTFLFLRKKYKTK